MPIVEMILEGDQFVSYRYGYTDPVDKEPSFIAGETMPVYVPTLNIDAATKNIGNLPGVARTEYPSTVSGDVTILSTPATYSNMNFTNTVVDIRANMTFNNCRFTLTSYTPSDSIGAMIRMLNGTSASNIVFNDCEFHVRCQRGMNVVSGRNGTFNRCILAGGVDGISVSPNGGATQSYGFKINDCWIGDHPWWYWTSAGAVHPSDTHTHNDGIQVSSTLGVEISNTFFGSWPSEFTGTGTPGSGSETNPWAGPYITTQATMEGWRTEFMTRLTRADQSFEGIPRKSTEGGSWAGIMANQPNITADHCYFSGGTVQINVSDNVLAGQNVGSFTRNRHWNDMTAGHSLTGTAKGAAIYKHSTAIIDIPTTGTNRNLWFDDTTVTPAVKP